MTVPEYLAWERAQESRNEYVDGKVIELVGAKRNHNRITVNLVVFLGTHLNETESPSEPFSEAMRVRITGRDRYRYPDVVVSDGESQLEDDEHDTLTNPSVVFEVLSPSSEASDRGDKFEDYRAIPTLNEYIIVDQDRIHVERWARTEANHWALLEELNSSDDELTIESVSVKVPLSKIYHRVNFAG